MLLNDLWIEKIVKNSSFIYISLNAATKKTHELINKGSNWEVVLENIKKLNKAKEKFNSGLDIHGHMTLVNENLEEIPLFIKSFKNLGFDSIDFGFDKSIPLFLRKNKVFSKKLRSEIKESLNSVDNTTKSNINTHRLKLLKLI